MPHKVYDLTLSDITQSKGLTGATLSGWRYVFPCGVGRYCAAEVGLTEDTGHVFHSVEEGHHVDSFISTYEGLHKHDLVVQYHYSLNYLRIPSCDVLAIWLRGDDHHHEMMIPLVTVQPHLEAGVTYSVREFMHIVECIAREKIMQEGMHSAVDDLTRIEGIGPKIAELLMQAGIFTFADLAGTEPARLREILQDGGPHYNRSDPTTWPEQATLARDCDWSALATLQNELKGGGRTEAIHKLEYDLTADGGIEFDTSLPDHYVVISSNDEQHMIQPPVWCSFDRRWGQYRDSYSSPMR